MVVLRLVLFFVLVLQLRFFVKVLPFLLLSFLSLSVLLLLVFLGLLDLRFQLFDFLLGLVDLEPDSIEFRRREIHRASRLKQTDALGKNPKLSELPLADRLRAHRTHLLFSIIDQRSSELSTLTDELLPAFGFFPGCSAKFLASIGTSDSGFILVTSVTTI